MMNHSTRVIGRLRRARPSATRTAVAAIATVGLALLTAACGGPSSAGSGDSPSPGGSASSPSALAFSQCMRSHGVPDFPDPGGAPHINSQSLGVSDSTLQAANAACRSLNPKSAQARHALTAQQQQDYLRAAACIRSHGISNFPDPTFAGGRVNATIPPGMSTTSPQFTQALQTCQRLFPAELGGSGSAG